MKPIKRHKALIEFSRDHHYGLLLCWKIRQGFAKGISPERISRYIEYFFKADLKEHFLEEEVKLFSKLPANDPLRIEAENQHKNIYILAEELQQHNTDKNLITRFAKELEDHIRFEERTLFNHLQENLSMDDLAEASTHNENSCRADDDAWEDHFWESEKSETTK